MVSSMLLHPLQAKSVQFDYCFDRRLRCIATRYTADSTDSDSGTPSCSFVFTSGISLLQETWIPVIKELFRLSSQSPSSVKIRSAWVIERPNHGEAALINAKLLKEHYSVLFPSLQYASAIHAFLTSDFLSASERNNLVGVGHSGGGGSLIQAVEYGLRDGHNIPLRSLVLVEAPFIGPEVWPFFQVLYDAVKRSNVRRATRWPSKDAAMKWFRTHLPWKTFSPEVLRIVEDTYFIPDMDHPGFITTKTAVEQETACFVDTTGTHLLATSFFRTIADVLPTHIIAGSAEDFWPPGVYLAIVENTTQVRSQLASVTVIDDVGHYIPTVKPHDLAATVFQTVARKLPSNLSKL
ncbi:Alpha/beta hydrolase fold-1 [Mycena belliarum]|uniref:Alpha/beta hydrolase fold-1 n=1 Tax=Mycena belliarum TaxID=1033014 RepID=A0AAD6UL85_9AGAR|nr:Alpha/beta hydrolase fold-1 [Mycena belliae]